jgi:hypothetical protein
MNSTLIMARNEIRDLKNTTDLEQKEALVHEQAR